MTKLQDSEGKSWALMAFKDAVGRIYIRAYINAWDAVKKRSYVQHRIQAGRLQDDGSIRLSNNFLARFPSFANHTWYWGDQELLKKEDYLLKFSAATEKPLIQWSDENIRVGVTWAGWQHAEQMEIFEDLKTTFGHKTAHEILGLALFKLDGQQHLSHFEDWVAQVWLPNIEPMNHQRISELLKSLPASKIDEYYKCRYERAIKNSPRGTTFTFDFSRISTRRETVPATGHAHPELIQANDIVVVDPDSGDVVYAYGCESKIHDQAILPTMLLRMQNAGINLNNNIVVTNRQLSSISATDSELKYIQFLSIADQATLKALDQELESLKDSIVQRIPALKLSAVTVDQHWPQSTKAGTKDSCVWLHLYRNPELAQSQVDELLQVQETKSKKVDTGKLTEKLKYAGCQAICSNVVSQAVEAMRIYRQRDMIEAELKSLEWETGTNPVQRGKRLVYTIAEAIRMHMRVTAKKMQEAHCDLKIPDDDLSKVLCRLQSVQAKKHRSSDAFVLGSISQHHRELFKLLGFDQKKLPKSVYRF